jgi:hypothetical protein
LFWGQKARPEIKKMIHYQGKKFIFFYLISLNFFYAIIVAVFEGLVREEQLLHDMCLLGAMTVEITQILTRAGQFLSMSEPLLRQNPVLSCDEVLKIKKFFLYDLKA